MKISEHSKCFEVTLEYSHFVPCRLKVSCNFRPFPSFELHFPCSKSGWRSAKLVYNKMCRALHDEKIEEVSV